MDTIFQIVGIVIACFLFYKAYKLYSKNHNAAAGIVLTIATIMFLCAAPWFQGWAKSFMTSEILSRLTSISNQVNTIQDTTTAMHQQLEVHQREISSNQLHLAAVQNLIQINESNVVIQQSEITNQFRRIGAMQDGLAAAQTNLDSQEAKLSDVEYWVRNLYANRVNETFSITTTNNLRVLKQSSNSFYALLRLNNAPIANSIEISYRDKDSRETVRDYMDVIANNLLFLKLFNYDSNTLVFNINYIANATQLRF